MRGEKTNLNKVNARIESGEIIEQKCWKFIQELNSYSEKSLNAAALDDGRQVYTYRQMFRQWEKYAEVFSALNITEKNNSRVGMLSTPAAEPVMAFYALNMTGTSVSMLSFMDLGNRETWNKLIEKEGITDLLLCDSLLQPEILRRIINDKNDLGLRNIIVLHVQIAGPFAPQAMTTFSQANYQNLKRVQGAQFMDEMLDKYEATPIEYGSGENRDDAIIIHTSGTTNGVHKPIPLSDRGFNEAVARHLRDENFNMLRGKTVSVLGMELSASYGAVDMMHLPLSFGGKLITMPLGQMNPQFAAAIQYYRLNVMFASPILFDPWLNMPMRWDFSSLKYVWIGGGYVSPDAKKRYNAYLKRCGSDARVAVGYGLAEIGASCIVASPDRDDDAIGYPLPGIKVKIFDENEGKYYDLEDGPRTGVLFLSSPSVSSGRIDDTVFFELDEIDGEPYLNTYDLVRVNKDGSLNCVGRMNKFFVNNEGIRFDAGLVETAVGAKPGITACGLAPGYDKMIHDTIPVLYVQTRTTGLNEPNIVRQALRDVFIRDNKIAETNLPGQCVITNSIPLTATGKVDVYQIVNNGVKGVKYKVDPIRRHKKLIDIRLIPVPAVENELGMWSGIPDELSKEIDIMNNLFPGFQNSFQPPQGFPFPQMPNMQQGFPFPQMPNILQGFPFPQMPVQGTDKAQGFRMPGMNVQTPQISQGFPFLQMLQGFPLLQMLQNSPFLQML